MSKLTKILKIGFVAAVLSFTNHVYADTGFKVPIHYNLELVDGIDSFPNYSKWDRTVTLTPGRHQIVVSFKDTFGGSDDSTIVQSSDAIVVDIYELKANQVLTFTFDPLMTRANAEDFARHQKVTLIDKNTEKPVSAAVAEYFVMTSEVGFTLMRDYRQELMSLGRLYAPTYVSGENRGIGMTSYGAPTIKATADGSSAYGNRNRANMTMDAPETSYAQESSLSTSSTSGGPAAKGKVSLNDLISLYNKADDKTKLQFVKYVMAH